MNWIKNKLGVVTEVISGTTPATSEKKFWGGQHVWVTPTDLGKLGSMYINSSERKLTNEGIENARLPLVPKNSVIMSSRAPIGHLAIANVDIRTNQGCKSFYCKEHLDPLYLYFYLKFCMDEIRQLGSGSTFSEVSKTQLENFEITYPESIIEQQRIASKLNTQLLEIEKARMAVELQLKEIKLLPFKLLNEVFEIK